MSNGNGGGDGGWQSEGARWVMRQGVPTLILLLILAFFKFDLWPAYRSDMREAAEAADNVAASMTELAKSTKSFGDDIRIATKELNAACGKIDKVCTQIDSVCTEMQTTNRAVVEGLHRLERFDRLGSSNGRTQPTREIP